MNRRTILALLSVPWVLTALPVLLLALLLLVVGVTLSGKLVACGVLGLWLPFPLFWTRKGGRLALGIMAAALGLLAIAWYLAPSGKSEDSAAFRSVFEGNAKPRRWTPSHLVPEVDQHLMGLRLAPALDPSIDSAKAERLATALRRIYAEMDTDFEFRAVGNVMGLAYADIFAAAPTGHSYRYLPPSAGDEPLPVIIFLHGSLGNFKGYLWQWKQFADKQGWAILAPSHGVGNWDNPRGMAEIEAALEICRTDPRLDEERIILAGLSNGGTGVIPILPSVSHRLRGVFLLSPVIPTEPLEEPGYGATVSGLPFLVVSGDQDQRIPADDLQERLDRLHAMGAEIETHIVPAEDHFLFYTNPDLFFDRLAPWLQDLAGGAE